MNKKYILPISLMLLVGITIFVSATMTVKTANEKKYSISVEVYPGWNIISGVYPPQQISSGSEIEKEDIKAVWFYSPIEKEYIQIYPELDKTRLQDYDDEYVFSSSMWVYSEKQGTMLYDSIVYSDFPSLETTQLISGWNFITITSEMEGKSLNDLKGSCNIERAHIWYLVDNYWGTISLDSKIGIESIGMGSVIKVSSDCNLGEGGSSTTPPP
ncbi:MAG: hypothetical protein AABX88_00525, partial [Nanoarchaeota archaeon]